MKVHIEWLDATRRTYDDVDKATVDGNRILRLEGHPAAVRRPIIADLPVDRIRELRYEDQ